MTELAIITGCTLGVLALVHTIGAAYFATALSRWRQSTVADTDLPTVAVLLSLRGADPYLADNLRRLLHQQYPRYEVHIVVDHPDDPAWAVVQQVVHEKKTGEVKVHVSHLRERRETCSLRNSALLQLVADLDETCEVVALVNGNITPHPDWLRELVMPLLEEGMGATSGNPWFIPEARHWGSVVRSLWNAASVVFRFVFGIPWGGTFAMRKSVLHRSGLIDKWAHAIVDDAPVRNTLREQGLRIKCVPSLMMVNREECSLAFSLDFMMRWMAWGRIYHGGWMPTICHVLLTAGGLALAAGLVLYGLITGQAGTMAWAGGGLVGYWLTMLGLLGLLESRVRRILRDRGESVPRYTLGMLAQAALAILLGHGLNVMAVLLATCKRRITWRGVTYHIRGPWDIRLLDDRSLKHLTPAADPRISSQ